MNRHILPIAAAILGIAAAHGASAQQAVVEGSGMNLSVAYPDGVRPPQQRSVGVVTGIGENQTSEHVGPIEGGFGTPGYTAVITGTGENWTVGYVRNDPSAAPRG